MTPTLAICIGSVNHPVHRVVQLGFIEGAKAEGLETPLISGLDAGSYEEQYAKWQADIAENGINGACLWTGDDSSNELLRQLHDAGVKTVVP